jgi:hypothetical protein
MPSDPLYIDPTEYEYYKQTHPPRVSDYTRRSPEELARDVTICHDNLRRQIRINDKLIAQLEREKAWRETILAKLEQEKLWRKVLGWMVTGLGAVNLIMLKVGLPLVLKGLAAK